jgi:phosphate transport system permease protein
MPAAPAATKPARHDLADALRNRNRFRFLGLTLDELIKYFFGGNAIVAVVVLGLITVFLFREGLGFFGQNLRNLRVYRLAGLEYVDFIRTQVDYHTDINRSVQALRLKQLELYMAAGKSVEDANARLAGFDAFAEKYGDSVEDVRGLLSDLTDVASGIKQKAQVNVDAREQRDMLLHAGKTAEADQVTIEKVDFTAEVKALTGTLPAYQEANKQFTTKLAEALQLAQPDLVDAPLRDDLKRVVDRSNAFVKTFPSIEKQMREWTNDSEVPWWKAVSSFVFGRQWLTASFWQDWYGLLPLLTGSILVSVIALIIAVPLGVSAAIYVSEIATSSEKSFIKPYNEFIAAIPSVVLGFFGIAVLGSLLRWVSQLAWLSWVPGFPMSERLNALTAGALLALMAIPTIFSLAEDALNNVPKSFKEASYALGANRFQTIVRILVPASLSGIISAVLLGFGRVIGETMVVLLCAGNRIAIPDFTQGLGAFVQPVHTMTGIIAQEMGEVVQGSIHYRALFMVGIILFLLSLLINFVAQKIVHRYRISIG